MGNVIKKLSIGLAVGGALVGITRALEFPFIFQMMFFGYAMLGAAVFMLLDAPSLIVDPGDVARGRLPGALGASGDAGTGDDLNVLEHSD